MSGATYAYFTQNYKLWSLSKLAIKNAIMIDLTADTSACKQFCVNNL